MGVRSRRRFLGESASILGATWLGAERLLGQPPGRRDAPDRPNVLVILTDQQRIDTLGYRGLTPCRTPHLDQLASEGISFDRCLTPSPICLPARTAFFTGSYPHRTRTMSNSDTLESEPVLLTTLRERGYQVDYAGKWGMGDGNAHRWVDRLAGDDREEYSRWCLEQGLEDGWAFNDPELRSHRRDDVSIPKTKISSLEPGQTYDAWVVDHAIRLLDTKERRRPFVLTCSLYGPHPPFKIPDPYYHMYDPDEIPEPPNFGPSPGEPRALERSFYRTVWRDHGETWDAWQQTVAAYWGYVTLVDAQIGRLVARLRQEGTLDQTLVIMSADHGEMLGQHGLWHKYHAYEEALRIPLIMRAPWLIAPGQRSQAGASLIDIVPTVFSALGLPAPVQGEGVDLSTAFDGAPINGARRLLFSEFKPKAPWHGVVDWRLVTDNRHKYIWNRGDIDELYDLERDPHELANLVDLPRARHLVESFRTELHAWMRRTKDPLLPAFDGQLISG